MSAITEFIARRLGMPTRSDYLALELERAVALREASQLSRETQALRGEIETLSSDNMTFSAERQSLQRERDSANHDLAMLRRRVEIARLMRGETSHILQYIGKSRSQFGQDLFVLDAMDFKRNGYFVEFGATNGVDISNTYLLETEFGWDGILAEPARIWHEILRKSRTANLDLGCVWTSSGERLTFHETSAPEFSTIESFSEMDFHKAERQKAGGVKYEVETISLIDLLRKYNAPAIIDYLSIDTEGSEYSILSNFDFSEYSFSVITCEHNFSAERDHIYNLLTRNGYVRVHEQVSEVDDWYIRASP